MASRRCAAVINRKWTDEETEAFVSFMEELVVDGYRAEGGQFKPGCFQRLADKMNEKFPSCGITKDHTRNKMKRMREKYNTAADMINCSGFGWNETKQCVEVDSKQVMDEWSRRHPNKHYTPGKPFPLFHRLELVFGKDRANGSGAQSAMDALEELEGENMDFGEPRATQGADNTSTTNAADHMNIEGSVGSPSEVNQVKGKGKRKAIDMEGLKMLANSFNQAVERSESNAKIIAGAIVGQYGEKIGLVLRELGFSVGDVVKLTRIFRCNPDCLKLFWGLDDEQRKAFVEDLLISG